jgi:N-acetylglucosaminyldiphosphoundecaprenol N-acetyl-beta-D-mannosaminyltransferase
MTLEKPIIGTGRAAAAAQARVAPTTRTAARLERDAAEAERDSGAHRLDDLPCIDIAACPVHVTDEDGALRVIAASAARPHAAPLAVSSINLDHVHHFGAGRRHLGDRGVQWLHLIDGAPIAQQVHRVTGADAPRLAGSDLIPLILDDADRRGLTVAVLGGSADVTDALRARMRESWPGVRFAGHWTPARDELADPARSSAIADELRAAGTDILLVCLGKPRQEEWIDTYGSATGAGALLAFGAVVDFLAGRVSRAPRWVSRAGLEWLWRLMLEPRRLARRYLIEGPPAYLAVRRSPFPQRV